MWLPDRCNCLQYPAATSCDRQDLIPHKVETNPFGLSLVEEKCGSGVNYVASQFFPIGALRENVLRQTLRAIAAIGVLDGFKNQISHIRSSYWNLPAADSSVTLAREAAEEALRLPHRALLPVRRRLDQRRKA